MGVSANIELTALRKDGGIVKSGRALNKLSDRRVRAFVNAAQKANSGSGKLSDGGGLYLTVTNAGSALWRLKYRFDKKERTFSLGQYPEVSLEAARAAREGAKAQLRDGRDPVTERRLDRAQSAVSIDQTFESAARAWLAMKKRTWSAATFETAQRALERDVFPTLGRLPVAKVTSAMMTGVIEKIISRDVRDTAAKILFHCDRVFRYAKARGLCEHNPARDAREVVPAARQISRRPALLDFDGLRDVLRRGDVAPLTPQVRLALRLCAFTAVRPENACEAEWKEFDLDGDTPCWTVPRAKMKRSRDRLHDHKVFLGRTIASELRDWRSRTGGKGFVFQPPRPGKNQHIIVETLDRAYSRTLSLSGKHTPSGWRAAFKTLSVELGEFSRDVTELALDHVHDNAVARAYDRGERLVERKRLMAWWDEQLVPPSKGVLSFPKTGTA